MSPLFPKDYWKRFERKENSKNSAKDETKQRVEKVSAKSDKYKSETQNKRVSPESTESPEKTGETGESGESRLTSVDDSKKSQNGEKFITQETVVGKDGRKVMISVYRIGEEEKLTGDKVVRRGLWVFRTNT